MDDNQLFLWLLLSNLTTFFNHRFIRRPIGTHTPSVASKMMENWPNTVNFTGRMRFWDYWLCILTTYNVFPPNPPLSNNTDSQRSAFRQQNGPNSILDLLKSVLYSLQTVRFGDKEFWIFTRRMLCHCLFIYLLVNKWSCSTNDLLDHSKVSKESYFDPAIVRIGQWLTSRRPFSIYYSRLLWKRNRERERDSTTQLIASNRRPAT